MVGWFKTSAVSGSLALLIAGCSSEQPSQSSDSAEPQTLSVNAAASAEQAPLTIQQQYQEFTAAALAALEADDSTSNHVTRDFYEQAYFEIGECSDQELANEFDAANDLEGQLAGLAERMARYRRSLSQGGYPPEMWEEIVRRYEAASLAEIERFPNGRPENQPRSEQEEQEIGYYRLGEELEAARATMAPELPPFRNGSECGGPVTVKIQSDPAGGRVWMIGRYNWEYCRRRFGDAYNVQRCRGWWEAEPDHERQIYGNFVSMSQWPNGQRGTSAHRLLDEGNTPSPWIVRVRPGFQGP